MQECAFSSKKLMNKYMNKNVNIHLKSKLLQPLQVKTTDTLLNPPSWVTVKTHQKTLAYHRNKHHFNG